MKRDDLEAAAAAALSVAFPLYKIFTMRESDGSPNLLTPGELGILLLVLLCYVAAPLPLRLLSKCRVVGLTWLWGPVLGSALVAAADYRFGLTHAGAGVARAAKGWPVLGAWTAAPAAAVYYSGAVVRSVRRWHEGPNAYPGILRE